MYDRVHGRRLRTTKHSIWDRAIKRLLSQTMRSTIMLLLAAAFAACNGHVVAVEEARKGLAQKEQGPRQETHHLRRTSSGVPSPAVLAPQLDLCILRI
jgi:hypothetical protein